MAVEHGRFSYFSVEDAAGTTLRNLTTYLTDVTFSQEQDEAQTTTKGQTWETFLQGHCRATIELTGRWDNTASTGPDAVLAGLLTDSGTVGFEWGPEGNTATDIKYSGECFLTAYEQTSPLAGIVGFTATLRVSGAVTKGAFS